MCYRPGIIAAPGPGYVLPANATFLSTFSEKKLPKKSTFAQNQHFSQQKREKSCLKSELPSKRWERGGRSGDPSTPTFFIKNMEKKSEIGKIRLFFQQKREKTWRKSRNQKAARPRRSELPSKRWERGGYRTHPPEMPFVSAHFPAISAW